MSKKDSQQPDNEVRQKEIAIELPEEIAEGIYSNLSSINFTPVEFVLDFVSAMPKTPNAKVKARIIMPPAHAKELLFDLGEMITKFEKAFHTIETPSRSSSLVSFPLNFIGPEAEA